MNLGRKFKRKIDFRRDMTFDKPLSINHILPEELETNFISHITLQGETEYVLLSFFDIQHPIYLKQDPDREAKLAALEHLNAKCVSRVAFTPTVAKRLYSILGDYVNRIEQGQQEVVEDEQNTKAVDSNG
jgi:hypothetical protein